MYVCLCRGVTDSQIKEAVLNGADSLRAVRKELGVMTGCGKCACETRDLVKDTIESTKNTMNFYQVA